MTCAYCGSGQIHRSRRAGPLDHALSVILVYPYRCDTCKKRSYTRSRGKTAAATRSWERIRVQLLVFAFGLFACLILIYFLIQERVPASE